MLAMNRCHQNQEKTKQLEVWKILVRRQIPRSTEKYKSKLKTSLKMMIKVKQIVVLMILMSTKTRSGKSKSLFKELKRKNRDLKTAGTSGRRKIKSEKRQKRGKGRKRGKGENVLKVIAMLPQNSTTREQNQSLPKSFSKVQNPQRKNLTILSLSLGR